MDEKQRLKLASPTKKIFISGGGPVGLMLAIGLVQKGFSVVLAEKNADFASEGAANHGSFDGRVLALTYASKLFLESLNLWSLLQPKVTEIYSVHVSQKGYLGVTHLHASEMGVPALGYSISGSDLGQVLWQSCQQLQAEDETCLQILCPAELIDLQQDEATVQLSLQTELSIETLKVDFVVGADGTQSKVRELLDLPIEIKDYDAYGVIAKIETELAPNHWAYERFTTQGPVALLPMGGNASKAVLVCESKDIDHVKSLDNEAFMALFAEKMGERLGAFTQVSKRVFYPLRETYVPQMVKGRVVLMGNAAHTQHPVAAQGLNLGIADIEAFLQQANQLSSAEIDEGPVLEAYAKQRAEHHQKIMGLTDGLIELFQAPSPVVGHLRGIGLMAMQSLSPLRKRFSKLGMGINQ